MGGDYASAFTRPYKAGHFAERGRHPLILDALPPWPVHDHCLCPETGRERGAWISSRYSSPGKQDETDLTTETQR